MCNEHPGRTGMQLQGQLHYAQENSPALSCLFVQVPPDRFCCSHGSFQAEQNKILN
jgi:hypothetical protein